jgi:hypothetical protein
MKRLMIIGCLLLASGGCTAMYSPYDLHTWCLTMGSARMSSVGAHDPATCDQEFEEDLTDQTPRFLLVPRDIVMLPVVSARVLWNMIALTQPPF